MRMYHTLLVVVLLFVVCRTESKGTSSSSSSSSNLERKYGVNDNDNIVFYGGSKVWQGTHASSNGFVEQFKKELYSYTRYENVTVNSVSYPSATTTYLMTSIDGMISSQAKKPTLIVMFVGDDDLIEYASSFNDSMEYYNEKAMLYQTSTSYMIAKCLQENIYTIVVTPLVHGEKIKNNNKYDKYFDEYTEMLYKISKPYNSNKRFLGVLNLRMSFLKYLERANYEDTPISILTWDGVHLSKNGNTLVAVNLLDKILLDADNRSSAAEGTKKLKKIDDQVLIDRANYAKTMVAKELRHAKSKSSGSSGTNSGTNVKVDIDAVGGSAYNSL